MNYLHLSLIACCLLVTAGCTGGAAAPASGEVDPEYTRQMEEGARQIEASAKQQEELQRQLDQSEQHAERYEKLLERWERHADRQDKLLDRQERQSPPPADAR
jgi:septal ring factor EnvC (AmiA/AmiB activator)